MLTNLIFPMPWKSHTIENVLATTDKNMNRAIVRYA